MKKIFSFLMLAMLAVCTVTMVSCKDDDDDKNNPLVGTWFYEERDSYGYYYDECTFNSNGTFTWREIEGTGWDAWNGTYAISGNKLTLVYEDNDVETYTFTISGDKLILTESDGDTYIYTKK